MTLNLATALADPDAVGPMRFATVKKIYANGLADVDFGNGELGLNCVIDSGYTPTTGANVYVERFNPSLWIIKGATRTSNPTTVTVGFSVGVPYSITPATPGLANPLVVSSTATRSYRSGDGWAGGFLPAADDAAQGAYSTANYGYYQGCYFYGSGAFTGLAGRRCTGVTIKLIRRGSGGNAGGVTQWIAPHPHPSQPSDSPYWMDAASGVGTLAWSASGTFALPTNWGQDLIDGKILGFGHRYFGTGDYSICVGKTGDSTAGQISLSWT